MTSRVYYRFSSLLLALTSLLIISAATAQAASQIFSEDFEEADPLKTNFDKDAGNCNAVAVSTAQSHHVLPDTDPHSLFYKPNNPVSMCTADKTPMPCCTAAGTGSGCDTTGDCNHKILTPITKFYISMWIWVSPTLNPCYAPGHHMWRFYTAVPDPGGGFYQFDTDINSGQGTNCSTGPVVVTLDPLFGGEEPGSGNSAYVHAAELERGTWTRMEVLFEQGTPGGANGSVMVWYTDSRGVHAWPTHGGVPDTGRSFVARSSAPEEMNLFKVVTNFDGAAASDYWYVDDIQIWDDCPLTGASCSTGSDSARPAAPSGLRAQ